MYSDDWKFIFNADTEWNHFTASVLYTGRKYTKKNINIINKTILLSFSEIVTKLSNSTSFLLLCVLICNDYNTCATLLC